MEREETRGGGATGGRVERDVVRARVGLRAAEGKDVEVEEGGERADVTEAEKVRASLAGTWLTASLVGETLQCTFIWDGPGEAPRCMGCA